MNSSKDESSTQTNDEEEKVTAMLNKFAVKSIQSQLRENIFAVKNCLKEKEDCSKILDEGPRIETSKNLLDNLDNEKGGDSFQQMFDEI